MFGPPCYNCGSEENWLPGKDGERCRCGWPDTKPKPDQSRSSPFGDTSLGMALGAAAVCLSILLGVAAILYAVMH